MEYKPGYHYPGYLFFTRIQNIFQGYREPKVRIHKKITRTASRLKTGQFIY